ncbi:hypothetical protein IV498_00195 [Paenarthrobacter sp. Z7-10]|uniref:hypothetical protein n=1 Tax=Paenarthrobacter sp. Z7-10 TaxID=2787635 RepID=UPI0022A9192A|nr:hypothetical protein [Paenarthrobacter sp. Z7-10]MCZ2401643.1 hypothetical protein [Paenarthrobacter sp. Z7-10]
MTASVPAAFSTGRRSARYDGNNAAKARLGHTRISTSALTNTVRAVAAQAFGVPGMEVKAKVQDDGGRLGITLWVPIVLPTLLQAARHPEEVRGNGGNAFDRADTARSTVHDQVTRLTGSDVGRIDIRLTGIHPRRQEKVQ